MCNYCGLKPKYTEGSKTHPYCGRTCAGKAQMEGRASSNYFIRYFILILMYLSNICSSEPCAGAGDRSSASLSQKGQRGNQSLSVANSCDWCHMQNKCTDKITNSPYCGQTCARKAKGAMGITDPTICIIPKCPKDVWSPSSGPKSKYCGSAHRNLGKVACLWCRQKEKSGHHHFCSKTCAGEAEALAPFLIEVYPGHEIFDSVAHQFNTKWLHPPSPGKKNGTARKVYKIVEKPSFREEYDQYRAFLEQRDHFKGRKGMTAGNERRRWHGTTRNCNIGDQDQLKLCNLAVCPVCNIIRTSFDLKYFTKWGRFGRGIYTSATSSKSNDYINNGVTHPYKAIFLAHVSVGRASIQYNDNANLTQPPNGYDSVIGEPKQGGSLNYDELIVYRNDAIRPSYLVMYDQ
ncbi:hypothetical protein SERLA73DRAFT_118039 [Serpula lacrymans var. lacrymans S7.3]|uniref:PARP catalytic domain-containing protein n=1 Tax=Serpula lacrymans var. lacrymans (strain S7.3) TaxID=936435 RepID=F8QIH0_SERL3|nr:hypothetical protein SERLA73DRAFT_118039 [Serpula lacrymans var. lacrymans S7.3]